MAAIQALVFFINTMFGGSTNLTPEQQMMISTTPEYQAAYTQNPTATQAIVIVDQNEL
jgi:hypothetical protein